MNIDGLRALAPLACDRLLAAPVEPGVSSKQWLVFKSQAETTCTEA
jgi:hypothetical protein